MEKQVKKAKATVGRQGVHLDGKVKVTAWMWKEERDALKEWTRRLGYKTVTDLLKAIAAGKIEEVANVKAAVERMLAIQGDVIK